MAYLHSNDTHDGYRKGKIAEDLFAETKDFYKQPVKISSQEQDIHGVDFISFDNKKFETISNWIPKISMEFFRIPVGRVDGKTKTIFNPKSAQYWAIYNPLYNKGDFFIFDRTDLKKYCSKKYTHNKDEYSDYLTDAVKRQVPYKRNRDNGYFDIYVFPPIKDIIHLAIRLEIPNTVLASKLSEIDSIIRK